ncbi:MAG TPA: DivIVA domain-containing protein [Nocardioidaceae bacterium]|jgi:DivIVA domain-containing protein|nr:DivIVA domain-containing protein [Nocardioidaceae bacterium]
MAWLLAIIIVLLIGAVAVVAAGHGPGGQTGLRPAYDDRPDALLPTDRPVTADDLRRLRLSTSVRGYRPVEVDALLERLAAQLDDAPRNRAGGHDSGRLS